MTFKPRKIQFIAYQLDTSLDEDRNPKYLGSQSARVDIESRCKIIADAAYAAANSGQIDSQALKIMALPEAFFRSQKGAYPIEAVSMINAVLDRYLANPYFRRWLFLLGSAMACMPTDIPGDMEIFNVCLVRKGGIHIAKTYEGGQSMRGGGMDSLIIYKEYISRLDFYQKDPTKVLLTVDGSQKEYSAVSVEGSMIRDDRPINVAGTAVVDPRTERPYTLSERSRSGLGGGGLFEMFGLQCGLEICIDHFKRRIQAERPRNLDLHFLLSCGENKHYIASRPGGYFFRVDGQMADPYGMVSLFKKTGTESEEAITTPLWIDMDDPSKWRFFHGSAKNFFPDERGSVGVFEPLPVPTKAPPKVVPRPAPKPKPKPRTR